jgi:hypothetical protein
VRRLLVLVSVLLVGVATFTLADDNDTAKATATRKLLKQKVTVEWKEQALRDAVDDLKEQVKGLSIKPTGVQLNTKITLTMKDAPLEEVLKAMCDKNEWGYYIISKERNAYDGQLVLKVGKERGYEEGKEPKTAKDDNGKDKKPDKSKVKDKAEAKGKKKTKDEDDDSKEKADKDKGEAKDKSADDPDRAERAAALKLKSAKELIAEDKKDRAKEILEDLVKRYSKTKAAEEAKKLLEKLDE